MRQVDRNGETDTTDGAWHGGTADDRGRRPGQALRGHRGPGRHRLRGGRGLDPRGPRAERGGKDDGGPDPHHPGRPRRRLGLRRRLRRGDRSGRRASPHRCGRPGRHARRRPHGSPEPRDGGRAERAAARAVQAPGGRAARAIRPERRRRPRHEGILGRHATAARHRRQHDRRGPRSSSSTSRPRGSTRPAARACGTSSGPSCPRGSRCCSPPSTSTRPTSWPTASSSSTTARVIAQGSPQELKAATGGGAARGDAERPQPRGRRRAPGLSSRVRCTSARVDAG